MNPHTLIFSLFLLVPSAALAHAKLSASSIEDGATVTGPLTEVSLTFTEAAELAFSTFKVHPLLAETGDDPGGAPAAEHSEDAESHDVAEAGAETEHGGGEPSGDAATNEDDHGDEGGHAALDAAAESLMADVMDAPDDAGARADTGVTPAAGQSETVTVRLEDDLEPGAYAVMWRVLSVDSHAIEGFLTFTYDPGE